MIKLIGTKQHVSHLADGGQMAYNGRKSSRKKVKS
jgi:hypothetical protein